MSERNNESREVGSREYYEKALNENVEYYIEAFKRLDPVVTRHSPKQPSI